MPTDTPRRDLAGIVIAALAILAGVVLWWDTTAMADPDSYVFPRAVIVAMIVFCLALIFLSFARPVAGAKDEAGEASTVRRIALVAAMLAGAAAMPVFGFFISGLAVFFVLTVVSMYERWTPFRLLVYPLAGVAIVAGFYVLFAELLLVPLPAGSFFE